GRERIVQQHDLGGFFGNFGAGNAHGDADVCIFEGGRVVDAVAGDGDHVALGLQFFDDAHFQQRRAAGDDAHRGQHPRKFFVGEVFKVRGLDRDVLFVEQVQIVRDGGGGDDVVAGEHFDLDACRLAGGHGAVDLGAQRVGNADEAVEAHAALGGGAAFGESL